MAYRFVFSLFMMIVVSCITSILYKIWLVDVGKIVKSGLLPDQKAR
jgi:hypothetical protein